jgi:hypothetical protein
MTSRVKRMGILAAKILGVLGCLGIAYGLVALIIDEPVQQAMGSPLGPLLIGVAILAAAGIVGVISGSSRARRAGLWALLGAVPGALVFGAGGLVGGGDNLGLFVGGVVLIALGVPIGGILGLATAKRGDVELNSPDEVERVSTTTKV